MTQPDPTVGRMVHFGELELNDAGEPVVVPRAATVTSVGPDTDNGIINLFVMFPTSAQSLIGVHHSETLKANCWSWPVRS